MSSTKRACLTAVCIALCYVLPLGFHALALGAAFSPIHLPVLLCGLVCGWPYGLFCGAAGPVLSSLLSGMPAAVQLSYMVPELCVYGFLSGLLFQLIRSGRTILDLYAALLPAMLLGRIAGGVAQALFYLSTARGYSLALWASGYLLGTLPGAILQLLVLPALVLLLTKAGLIPARLPRRHEDALRLFEPRKKEEI